MGNVQSGTAETARALPRGPLGIGCSSSASLGMDFLSLLAHPSASEHGKLGLAT